MCSIAAGGIAGMSFLAGLLGMNRRVGVFKSAEMAVYRVLAQDLSEQFTQLTYEGPVVLDPRQRTHRRRRVIPCRRQ